MKKYYFKPEAVSKYFLKSDDIFIDIIEAIQFRTNNDDGSCMNEIGKWVESYGREVRNNNTDLLIQNPNGYTLYKVGDWIIKGIDNNFYKLQDILFKDMYEELS